MKQAAAGRESARQSLAKAGGVPPHRGFQAAFAVLETNGLVAWNPEARGGCGLQGWMKALPDTEMAAAGE